MNISIGGMSFCQDERSEKKKNQTNCQNMNFSTPKSNGSSFFFQFQHEYNLTDLIVKIMKTRWPSMLGVEKYSINI